MSYLARNICEPGVVFGPDSLSQLLKVASVPFDPVQYDSLVRVPLPRDTLFQILEISDTTKSYLQELEVLKELQDEQNINTDKLQKSKAKIVKPQDTKQDVKSLYKLLLQDTHRNLCYGIEFEKLNFLNNDKVLPIPLGSKIIIKKGTTILRGCLLISNSNCIFLGGSILELNQNYAQRRISTLEKLIK